MSITVNVHGLRRGSFFFTQHELGDEFWSAVMGGAEEDARASRLLAEILASRGIHPRLIQFDWPSQSAEVWT